MERRTGGGEEEDWRTRREVEQACREEDENWEGEARSVEERKLWGEGRRRAKGERKL